MIYTAERAYLLSNQLLKLKDSSSWIVVGQYANIDFWMGEVIASLKALDEHNSRFDKMYEAQKNWIESHNILLPDHCSICQGICELGNGTKKVNLPRKSAQTKYDKKESKKELLDAVYYFLLRCYKLKLLDEKALRTRCKSVGTSVDLVDLES